MMEQLMELSRRATESSLRTQQTLLRHWAQGWLSTSTGMASDWGADVRNQWIDLATEVFKKHREALEATRKASIETMEKAFRVCEAQASEASLTAVEDVWKSILEVIQGQVESQLREVQSLADRLLTMANGHNSGVGTASRNGTPPAK
jgi:hypothetical protein